MPWPGDRPVLGLRYRRRVLTDCYVRTQQEPTSGGMSGEFMMRTDARPRVGAVHDRARTVLSAALTTALVAGGLALTGTPAASAPAGEQTWETGVIRSVVDGDTVSVDVTSARDPGFIAPSGTARSYCAERVSAGATMPADGDLDACRIRLIGIQAPEKAGASGGSALEQCRASSATAALAAVLPKGTPVQLRSISAHSVENDYSGGRLARTVYFKSGNQWVDAGRAVLAGGHAMWFPFSSADSEKPEPTHNLEYRRLVDTAAAKGLGLWSPTYCGTSAAARLRTWVVSDPIGDDANNEYVVLLNEATSPLDVSGWTVRDSSLVTYTLPAGTVIGAGDHIRILTGAGAPRTPTTRDFHFGGPSQLFANAASSAGYFMGDGAYVHDVAPGYAYGNLRSWFTYPCDPASCRDPLLGKVVIGVVQYNPPGSDTAAGEYLEFRNTTGAPIRLGGYAFTRQGSQYPFPPGTLLPARATIRLSMGTGTNTASTLYLGRTSSLLANSGDQLALVNLDGAPVDCRAWGSKSCTGMPVSSALPPPPAVPAKAPAPASAPKVTTPAPAQVRPGAPTAVTTSVKSRRIRVRWVAPAANGSPSITKYRAKVYQVRQGKAPKKRATCTARGSTLTCRTKKLTRKRTYVVVVQARTVKGSKGYGPRSVPVSVRVR